ADLRRMLRTQFGDTTPFTVHSDDAPTVYVQGNPGRSDPAVRTLERESAALHWVNPYTGLDEHGITVALADPVQENILHMVTADPMRTPTFTLFADPDWFFFATGGAVCPTQIACATNIASNPAQTFACKPGDIQDEIASTWALDETRWHSRSPSCSMAPSSKASQSPSARPAPSSGRPMGSSRRRMTSTPRSS